MKKGIIFILLTIFPVFFVIASSTSVRSSFNLFGGKITSTLKALEIQELEESGFVCNVPGTTIEILPIGSSAGTPTSYFIPSYVKSSTRTTPKAGQLIMGKYSGTTSITCIWTGETLTRTRVVPLRTVNYFGTSR